MRSTRTEGEGTRLSRSSASTCWQRADLGASVTRHACAPATPSALCAGRGAQVLGTTAVTTRALLETPELIDWGLLPKALMGLLALLCGNGCAPTRCLRGVP